VWSGLVGIVVALLWLDVVGDAPIPLAVKVTATAIWAVLSTIFYSGCGRPLSRNQSLEHTAGKGPFP
jgi:hypothetical protein